MNPSADTVPGFGHWGIKLPCRTPTCGAPPAFLFAGPSYFPEVQISNPV